MTRSARRLVVAASVSLLVALVVPPAAARALGCGSGWEVVPSSSPGTVLNTVNGVAAVSTDEVWMVGYSKSDGPGYRTLVERWDGGAWSVVPSPNLGQFDNVLNDVDAVPGAGMVAVGYFSPDQIELRTLVQFWDGTKWKIVPTPRLGSFSLLTAVDALSPTDIWAVGYFDLGSGYRTLTMHWNGIRWVPVPSPTLGFLDTLRGVAAIDTDDVWAVGYDGDTLRTRTIHWDGNVWSTVSSPSPGLDQNFLHDVSGTTTDQIFAVGYWAQFTNERTLVEEWDGEAWNVVPSPNAGSGNRLNGVHALSGSNAWAAGLRSVASGLRTLIQRWNGATWSIVPSPNTLALNNTLNDITAVSAGDLWAVGQSFDGSVNQTLTLRLCV